MSRLVYSSLTDEEADLPAKLTISKLAASKPAVSEPSGSARSRVRVIGSTVHVSGAVTALVIDRVCAAVDHLHSLGATGIRVEMDDADSSAPTAPGETAMPVALRG